MTVTIIPVDGPITLLDYNGELPLERAQEIVGGYVEMVISHSAVMQMILNEEGKLNSLPLNARATEIARWSGMITDDVIVGPAILLSDGNQWT